MISSEEILHVRQLIEHTWQLSGLPKGDSIADYNILAWHINDDVKCDVIGKSIKELAEVTDSHLRRGFLKNTTKEVLALYFFFKTGRIKEDKIEYVVGNKTRKPKPLYWRQYVKLDATPETDTLQNCPDGLCSIPEVFAGTNWWCYASSPRGIFKQLMVIHEEKHKNGFNKIEVLSGIEAYEDFEGYVAMDLTRCYLIFNAVTKISKQKNVHVKARLGRGVSLPSITLGQMNFISSYESKILTKTLVFERIHEKIDPSTINTGHIEFTSPLYETLNPLIRDYLYKKDKNRLASPIQDIANLDELADWMEEQKGKSKTDEILKSYQGRYFLYRYLTDDRNRKVIEETPMRIQYCPAEDQMHVILEQKDRFEMGSTLVHRYDKFVSVLWESKLNGESRTLYLNFRIGHMNYEGFQCFSGIMTGVSREIDAIASYQILLVKEDTEFERIKDKRLQAFFEKQNNEIISDPVQGFKLNKI